MKTWKERLIALGIMVLFVLFVGYSIETFLIGENNQESYARNVFIICIISGIVVIIISNMMKYTECVSLGLLGGGILTIMYGAARFWDFSGNIIRVLLLALSLGILIWVGIKKTSRK